MLLEDARKSMVNDLVPSVLRGDTWFLHRFFQSYQSVGTTQQVLELLLKRCMSHLMGRGIIPFQLGLQNARQSALWKLSAISTVLCTWLDTYHQHFNEPPDFRCLKQLVEYLQLRLPGSDLEHRALLLLAQLQDPVPVGAESKGTGSTVDPSDVQLCLNGSDPAVRLGTCSCAALSSLPEEESAGSESPELQSDPELSAPAKPPRPSSVATTLRVQPLYNQQVGDSCIIRVSMEEANGNMYKSVLVTCNDRTPTIIQKAMDKHFIDDDPQYYELLQIVSDSERMKIPEGSNIFYTMKSNSPYNFILKQQTFLSWLDVSPRALSTLRRWKKRGLKAF
ncbi:Ral guanine nucleotide dissociation stimulator [Fukomys damarensis]|uniref:Ral guanine nucleotide dissociation stimulator n=1 Tax=Fukomys damarensis TaxID=885580 RepID=A0A091CRY9_FUKDA|nr:Ral guanine nucleotide dissociation stimulator [Fukomys damarensis]